MSLGLSALGCALFFGFLAYGATRIPGGWVAAIALAAGSIGGWAGTVWSGMQLHAWPSEKLALFRDRLLVINGRHEMRALWDFIDSVTLADPRTWPELKMTDTLTVNLRNEPALRFKPAQFGLDSAGCRDLILRLRDEPGLRERLPEFDSVRDLAAPPVVAGEMTEPRF